MTAQAASIPRKIPGALRQPNIATIATRKTAGMMKIEGFIVCVCVVWRCVVQLRRHYPTESPLARKSSQKVKILSRHAANVGNIRDCQATGKLDHKQTSHSAGQITAPSYTGSDYPCRKRSKLDGPRWLAYGLLSNIQGVLGRASK